MIVDQMTASPRDQNHATRVIVNKSHGVQITGPRQQESRDLYDG